MNFIAWREQIIALAMRHGIAASYTTREFVVVGGLMSYGPDQKEVSRQIGLYAGRILKGVKPRRHACAAIGQVRVHYQSQDRKAQAIAIPPALLALADEVIE